ncbi:CBS domain-containing protein [Nocardia nepalensis]|uniref:CBS domain-containing protein n=1 Tax=Nocardia nepalensis TaxID=3375448 RepID=UPI003B678000
MAGTRPLVVVGRGGHADNHVRTRILSRPVVTVHPETPLHEAISLLTENGSAALPVVDDEYRERVIASPARTVHGVTHIDEVRADAVTP